MILAPLLLVFVAMATAEVGYSDNKHWAYQWYAKEPFSFRFENADPTNNTQIVVWETPRHEILADNMNSSLYVISDYNGILNGELFIKEVTPETRGVYVCYLHHVNDAGHNETVKRSIFGINISIPKYRSKLERYRGNIIVAAVASAIFLVVGSVVVLTHTCSYEKRMEDHQRALRGKQLRGPKHLSHNGDSFHSHNGIGIEIATQAYDNPEFMTQM